MIDCCGFDLERKCVDLDIIVCLWMFDGLKMCVL